MQDAAPRLIPSLIEMLNTGYDEICEVQYNLLTGLTWSLHVLKLHYSIAWPPWYHESTIVVVE